jgi:cell division protein YceG involved in septum cleavage
LVYIFIKEKTKIMSVAELVLWLDRAIEAREASYVARPNATGDQFLPGSYKLNNQEALEKTMRGVVTKYEKEIASALIPWGNDITDWKRIVDIENQHNSSLVDRKSPWGK